MTVANESLAARPGRRPPSVSDPKVQILLTALQQGQFVSTACDLAGLHRSTVARWIKRGEEAQIAIEVDGLDIDVSELAYCDLCDAIKKARATAQMRALDIIQEAAATGTWQAAAWYLERAFPERWGRFPRTAADDMPSGVPADAPTAQEVLNAIEEHIQAEVERRLKNHDSSHPD